VVDALLVESAESHENEPGRTDGWSAERNALVPEQYMHEDKEALARLLEVGLRNRLAQGQQVDLENDEEFARLIPLFCTYFSRAELIAMLGEQVTLEVFKLNRIETLQNLFLEKAFRELLHAFNEAGVEVMLFKGPALAYQFYPRPQLRTYHDFDLLIRPQDLERARKLLLEAGYIYYEEFSSNTDDTRRSGYNFLLKQENSWLEILVELHTAPHTSEIGTQFDVEGLWKRAERFTILGEPVLIMHYIDHLLYLCWHYRFHGFTRLLWLYDLVVILRAKQEDMDWRELIARARELNLTATLFYCLSWSREIFHVAITGYILRCLRPPLISRLVIERFALPDSAKALASVQMQPQRIIARRVMVDSFADLLKAGLRALFPSRAAIGRRYLSPLHLPSYCAAVFYAIHPWITLLKGLQFLLKRQGS